MYTNEIIANCSRAVRMSIHLEVSTKLWMAHMLTAKD